MFVATDNVAMRDEFERSYGAVSAPHWYPQAGIPVHRSPSRPDPGDVGVDALVDLYLLTGCEHLICDSFSNFSQVARALSVAPRSQITDVQRLRARWAVPLRAAWRLAVPGPATPLALAMARRWAH